jgi:two-component system response regulator FlrC
MMNMNEKKIVTRNASMWRLIEMAETVAATKANVLILGESGCGKELFARLIHDKSYRNNRELVAINCAALPDQLVESELFGFEKGSFTGSVATKPGKFEIASGSTLLLDEISEMGIQMQAKLLRAIQESQVDRIGSISSIDVDSRIIATSNKNLYEEVKAGRFREDLYYRLNVVVLNIPALRARVDDIEILVWYFINMFNMKYEKEVEFVSTEVMTALKNYSYPGNVRELMNMMERAILFSKGKHLSSENIKFEATNNTEIGSNLRANEKRVIMKALDSVNGNRTRAAEKLGISVRTLRNKLKLYRESDGFLA